MDFEEKILAQAIVAKSSTDPYHWEEESSNSQVKITLIYLKSITPNYDYLKLYANHEIIEHIVSK